MNRTYSLIGNGKLFQAKMSDVTRHAATLAREFARTPLNYTRVAYAPPVPFLNAVAEILKANGAEALELASQSVSWRRHGMDTGGIFADSLRALGVSLAIVNHWEQKAYLAHAPTYHKMLSSQIVNSFDC